MKPKDALIYKELLREHGYRITPARIALLSFLSSSKKPLTVGELQEAMGTAVNKVTLYRALEDFVISKIVSKINLNSTAAYYEFLHPEHHHHHILCEACGTIEDIEHCEQASLQNKVLQSSKKFSSINSHSLEFFGVCKACSKK